MPWGEESAAPVPAWPPGQIGSREIAQLRLEIREELEQVKNDLFGAATGVSALKDRVDGLEHLMTKSGQPAPLLLEELQIWINERIEQAVVTAVTRAFEAALGGTSGRTYPQDRVKLSEPPVVLSSRPS